MSRRRPATAPEDSELASEYDVSMEATEEFPLDGADKMAVQMRVESDDIGAADNNLITRQYLVEVEGSLNDMQVKGHLAEWTPFDGCEKRLFQSHRHGGTSGVRADTRGGDIEHAVLHSMYLKEVQSDYPCSLGLTVSGVKGNRFTANGERYADVILPGTNSNSKRCLANPSPYINSAYLSMFPGMTRSETHLRTSAPPTKKKAVVLSLRRSCI